MPVVVAGFKQLPEFGDEFTVVASEKEARKVTTEHASRSGLPNQTSMTGSDLLKIISHTTELTECTIIIKADVQGSLTSVIDALKTLDNEEVAIKIVGSGVGNITERDIYMAATSQAIIYGFNVALPSGVRQLAARDKVSIRLFNVIYELIDDAKKELSLLLKPELKETVIGILNVKAVFKTTKSEVICGGEVLQGKLTVPAFVRVIRAKEVITEVEATLLKRGPQEAREVVEGELCGVTLRTFSRLQIQEGDKLEFFIRETIERSLQ
jgi:translation initiation factor IF-2